MSSLGIFKKETKTYQKVAGTAEVAVVDKEMSDTSVNPVQNKVIKKYVDSKQVNIDGVTLTLDEARNVIKLADTLKDKIGSALQPESIVNNQTTTEAGFALDARQANPNIDGTLAKQVADLNGSLGTLDFIPDGRNLNHYTSGVYMIREADKLENSPDASWSILIAFGTISIYSVQIVISVLDSQNSIYVRTKNERNEWCSWFKK